MAIITNPHYTEVTTNTTLTAVEGKQYNVKNTGSSTITITYGSDTLLLSVGFTCILYYVKSTWALLGAFNKDGVFTVPSVSLVAGRKVSDALTTTGIASPGWYVFAELASGVPINNASASFQVSSSAGGRHLGCDCAFTCSTSARTHTNSYIRLKNNSNFDATYVNVVEAFKIIKSDTNSSSGAKLAVYINSPSARDINILMTHNTSTKTDGWELVPLTTVDNDKTPDGVVGTDLIAGEEFCLESNGSTLAIPGTSFYKSSNDQVRCMFDWGQLAYDGSTLTLVEPSAAISLRDGTNASTVLTGTAYTLSNLLIDSTRVSFYINLVGAFSAINSGPLSLVCGGTGGKLIIS